MKCTKKRLGPLDGQLISTTHLGMWVRESSKYRWCGHCFSAVFGKEGSIKFSLYTEQIWEKYKCSYESCSSCSMLVMKVHSISFVFFIVGSLGSRITENVLLWAEPILFTRGWKKKNKRKKNGLAYYNIVNYLKMKYEYFTKFF